MAPSSRRAGAANPFRLVWALAWVACGLAGARTPGVAQSATDSAPQPTPAAQEATRAAGAPARVLAVQADTANEAGLPFFEVFSPRDYRGHTQVWNAVEDAAGIVYFGNYGGVLVYDGARWDRLEVPGTSFVRALAVDADDTLWLGGVDELGYARDDPTGRRVFVSLKNKLPPAARAPGEFWRVLPTPHGPLFQSNFWLLRWNGEAFASLPLEAAGAWQAVLGAGHVWVSNAARGWFQLRDDSRTLALTPVARPAEFAGASLVFATPGRQGGELVFGTSRAGLARWDGSTFTPFETEIDATLKERRLYRGAGLADGRLVVSTLQAGAFILDPAGRLLARLDQEAGLPDNGAITPVVTRDGTLWITLQRGMVRVDTRPWVTWFDPARGAPRSTLQPAVRYRGEFYVCSDVGLLRLAPATATTPARLVPVPQFPDELYGLVVVDDVLLGYGDSGVFTWTGGERTPLPGITNNTTAFLPAHGQPGRWFAQANGGLYSYRRDAGRWIAEGQVPDLQGMRSLAPEPDGTWWVGTPKDGVWRITFPAAGPLSPGRPAITRFTAGEGLPAGHGWCRVSVDAGGPLLRCEQGLFRFDRARQAFAPTREFGERFADGSTTLRTLESTADGDGRWIVARPAGEAELVTTLEVGVVRGAAWQTVELPHLTRMDDVSDLHYEADQDVLWIGGHSGLVRLELAGWRAARPPPAPHVLLRGAQTLAGERLPLAGGWSLPFDRRSVRLDFAAPALGGVPGVRYESTLQGAGAPIVQTDGSPQRTFSALAPGSYRFQLRAARASGAWSEPVTVAFAILPPWWLGAWAKLGYLVVGLAAVAGTVAQRTRALRRRAARLEGVVAERTEELRRSNVELARLHQLELDEKIAARLDEEKARLEVLRYQLNPHFLFNAFATLRGLIFQKPEAAGTLTLRLSEFCRQSFMRGSEICTAREEIAMLRGYLDAEQARWGDSLRVTIAADSAAIPRQLPPFLLLPLVENAIKYGGHTSPDVLELRLAFTPRGEAGLAIEVANTGTWIEPGANTASAAPGAPVSTGLGLENIRRRLARHYPGAHALTVVPGDGWVRVHLTLETAPREPASPAPRPDR